MTVLKDLQASMENVLVYIRNHLFSEKTCLIYDHIVVGREEEFPSAAEIHSCFPNPCGYSTGMEDGMLSGATMLDACLIRYEKEHDHAVAAFCRKLVKGMLDCAFSAKSAGFLPRAVALEDGVSHYPDSSRDQYTMFAFAMHRYLNTDLCSPAERQQIAKAVVAIACRAQKNVTQETGFDMLTDEGRPTRATVMWGNTLGNHEYMRLPMLYLLAYEASGDSHWWNKYAAIREEAYEKSLPMGSYWALYTLQQMQAAIRLCYDADPDLIWKERYLSLMHIVADYAESLADGVLQKINACSNCNAPQPSFRQVDMVPHEGFIKLGYADALHPDRPDAREFFTLQDGAQVAIVTGLVPGRTPAPQTLALLRDAFAKIDLSIHQRNLPLYYFDGYYRSIL